MAKKNIFLYDVDIPEVVQDKAEEAFLRILAERESAMEKSSDKKRKQNRRLTKIMAAAVACAVIVLTVNVFTGRLGRSDVEEQETAEKNLSASGTEGEDVSAGASDMAVQETGEEKDTGAPSALDKMFTLYVKAAEADGKQSGEERMGDGQATQLSVGKSVPLLSSDKADSWVLGGDDANGNVVDYCISMPFTCVGDHIEKITYSINNGAFQIVQPENASIIIDGQLYEGELSTGSIGGDYDEENGGLPSKPFETVLYRSFTLDYNRQTDEDTWINICNNRPVSKEVFDTLWGEGKRLEDMNNGIQQMLDNTVITCTVQYSDQTSQTVTIKVGSKVMSCAEAGEEPKYEGEESVYVTFELQE